MMATSRASLAGLLDSKAEHRDRRVLHNVTTWPQHVTGQRGSPGSSTTLQW